MRTAYTFAFVSTAISSFIGLSSHAGSPPVSSQPAFEYSSHAEPPQRARSRSPVASYRYPPTRLPSPDGLGYGLDQLQFIRLIPIKNMQRKFELHRYTFPLDKGLKLLERQSFFSPMPSQEQIVLSTGDGDVFAILASNNTLAGIYRHNPRNNCKGRAKINMRSSRVTLLNSDEIEEVPVGQLRTIRAHFRVENVNHIDGSSSNVSPHLPAGSRSQPALLFTEILGYGIDELQFIRLCYRGNSHRLFELRRYTFPADKPIKIVSERHRYRPINIQEQIVLLTAGGDIFAIFEKSDILAGIYAHDFLTQRQKRAKMNIETGRLTFLTADEIRETPVGKNRPIKFHYVIKLIGEDTQHH